MKVELLYTEGCPHWRAVDGHLRALAGERGFELERRIVRTNDQALAAGFRGSPTVLVDGRDPFAGGEGPAGLSCRLYPSPAGAARSPTLAPPPAAPEAPGRPQAAGDTTGPP